MQLMAARETEAQFWRRPSRPAPPPAPTSSHTRHPEREQKPEQHLEIAIDDEPSDVSAQTALMLDAARRFTEAASDQLNMRLTSLPALSISPGAQPQSLR
jgi:hypothetical protein